MLMFALERCWSLQPASVCDRAGRGLSAILRWLPARRRRWATSRSCCRLCSWRRRARTSARRCCTPPSCAARCWRPPPTTARRRPCSAPGAPTEPASQVIALWLFLNLLVVMQLTCNGCELIANGETCLANDVQWCMKAESYAVECWWLLRLNMLRHRLRTAPPAWVGSSSEGHQPRLPTAPGPPRSGGFPCGDPAGPCGGGEGAGSVARTRAAAGLSTAAACCQAQPGAHIFPHLQQRQGRTTCGTSEQLWLDCTDCVQRLSLMTTMTAPAKQHRHAGMLTGRVPWQPGATRSV